MKLTDGLFLKVCGEVAKLYPTIKYDAIIVDNACMQMASKPQQFDVLVTPNLYGNIIDNVGAGLTGGAGFLPGGSIGQAAAVFEQGASAGNVGIQSAGKNSANPVAVLLASAMMLKHMKLPAYGGMLEARNRRRPEGLFPPGQTHPSRPAPPCGWFRRCARTASWCPSLPVAFHTCRARHAEVCAISSPLQDAVFAVLGAGKVRTLDMGGTQSTKEFTAAVVDYIRHLQDTDKERH